MVKELLFEGSNRCFDQALYADEEVTENDIKKLCKAMKEEAVKNSRSAEQKSSIKDVTKQQLLSWGVLVRKNDKIYPSNAFAILTGAMLWSVTQCGVFKGDTKAIFVDRREYRGPIWEQIEQAYQFVLRNIHMGATFAGLYRQDVYEIPPDAIRELIINAAVHRSYLDHGSIQVALYDNRLEITSPGKLPMGQNLERMQEGYSRIRNEALAYAFAYMNLIEHWGSGFPRIIRKLQDMGLRAPELIGGDIDLRINLYRNTIQDDLENQQSRSNDLKDDLENQQSRSNDLKDDLENQQSRSSDPKMNLLRGLLEEIDRNENVTYAILADKFNVSTATIKRTLLKLQQSGTIIRTGSKRKSKWHVVKERG